MTNHRSEEARALNNERRQADRARTVQRNTWRRANQSEHRAFGGAV